MNLDFLDVLSQPEQKHREQVGTEGTGSVLAPLSVPGTSPATGNRGNKIPAPTANAETCSHVLPVYSQSVGTGRPNVDAPVPGVPGVPSENGQVRNAETGVLAEQETVKTQVLSWVGARCAWSPFVWGSEESLYQDYREWCQDCSQPPCPRELFCTILSEWFQRDAEGWQGLCLAVDLETSRTRHARPAARRGFQGDFGAEAEVIAGRYEQRFDKGKEQYK